MMATPQLSPGFTRRALFALERREVAVALAVACVLAARLWISPLPSSFWTDETGTVWAISGDFRQVLAHLGNYQFPQMPAYIILLWSWTRIAGGGEVALRIPSVLAMAAAAILLYRLGLRLTDRIASAYSVLLLVTLGGISFAAADARTYAFAILCVIWAYYELTCWIQTRRLRHIVLHGVAWGLTLNFCPFFGAAMIAEAVYLLIAARRGQIRMPSSLLLFPAIAFFMAAPLLPMMLAAQMARQLHVYEQRPTLEQLAQCFAPWPWVLAAAFGAVTYVLFPAGKPWMERTRFAGNSLFLLAAWAVVPPVFLFIYSLRPGNSVFTPRYLLSQAPAMALLGGCVLSILRPALRRASIAACPVLCAVALTGVHHLWTSHTSTDYRAAAELIRDLRRADPSLPVMMGSGFVESARLPMPPTSEQTDFLLAQLHAYPVGGDVTFLPIEVNDNTRAYIDSVLSSYAQRPRFASAIVATSPWQAALALRVRAWFEPDYRETVLHDDPEVVLFERRR